MHVDATPNLTSGLTASGETTEIDQLKRYLRAIRLRWPIILVLALLGAAAGWVLTPEPPKIEEGGPVPDIYYTATHTLVTDSALDPLYNSDGTGSTLNLGQIAFLSSTGEVPQRVAERLGMSADDVTARVIANVCPDVSSLEIKALGSTADDAVLLADTMASELVDYVNELVTERYNARRDATISRVDELQQERLALEAQLEATTDPGEAEVLRAQLDSVINDYRLANEAFRALAQQGAPESGLSTIESAEAQAITETAYQQALARIAAGPDYVPPTAEQSDGSAPPELSNETPDPKIRAGIGGFMGMLAGLILVLVLDRYDTRLRRRLDVEVTTGLPVLAEVPPLSRRQQGEKRILSFASPRSPTAEAFRVIRTALLFKWGESDTHWVDEESGRESRVVMITSASPGEGKTTTVANLAAVLAEGGQSVLVIDCDFRRPAIERYLLHEDPNAVVGEGIPTGLTAAPGSRLEATDIAGVKLIVGFGEKQGELKPVEIIESLRRVVEVARRHFDIVLLDTAPMLTTNDASDLMPEVDTLLFVVRNGSTRREKAYRACEFLRRLDAPALGVIFNAADETPATYYYYGYVESSSDKRRRRSKGGDGEGVAPTDEAAALT